MSYNIIHSHTLRSVNQFFFFFFGKALMPLVSTVLLWHLLFRCYQPYRCYGLLFWGFHWCPCLYMYGAESFLIPKLVYMGLSRSRYISSNLLLLILHAVIFHYLASSCVFHFGATDKHLDLFSWVGGEIQY